MTHDSPSDADPPEGIKNMRNYLGLPPTDPKDPQADLDNTIRIKLENRLRKFADSECAELGVQYSFISSNQAPFTLDEAIDQILALFQAHQQELLSELLGELETPIYPETMEYVEMVKKASEGGKYDDMFDNGFKAARSVIEKYREGL